MICLFSQIPCRGGKTPRLGENVRFGKLNFFVILKGTGTTVREEEELN